MLHKLLIVFAGFCLTAAAQEPPFQGGFFSAADANGVFPSMIGEGPVVPDAPYSGEGVEIFEETLADGNQIRREKRTLYYRDRAGRTRREETESGQAKIFINDPVDDVYYILYPAERTGQILPKSASGPNPGGMPEGLRIGGRIGVAIPIPAAMLRNGPPDDGAERTEEDLGERVIAGVQTNGTRVTTILPAELFGALRDIEITSERWYSEELNLEIETTRDDPRNGKTTYRLTNLNRTEPLSDLFVPPPDYQMQEFGPRILRGGAFQN